MKRRTFLGWLARLLPASLFGKFAWSQQPLSRAPFDEREVAILHHIASTTLPSSLGEREVNRVVGRFSTWLTEYRSAAEMPHEAGRLDAPRTPTIEVERYVSQLSVIADANARQSTTPLAAILEQELTDAGVDDLPSRPDGRHIVSDLMSFYFRSSEANDLGYEADIGRKTCRGLPGTGDEPSPLPGSSRD